MHGYVVFIVTNASFSRFQDLYVGDSAGGKPAYRF